jgi:hypothetical protein
MQRDTKQPKDYIEHPCWGWSWWHSMEVKAWLMLLKDGGFRVSPSRIPRAVFATCASIYNSAARLLTDLEYGRTRREAKIADDPVFIIGHWRSGTTLLHELLTLDEKLYAPNTYQCFNPGHFLLTMKSDKGRLRASARTITRPQDNIEINDEKPQEDEFALMMFGAPSFYGYVAFPARIKSFAKRLFWNQLSTSEQRLWRQSMLRFLASISIRETRRLLLKNPCNTAKIPAILELLPRAKFIYISRNPFDIIPSQQKASAALCNAYSLQKEWSLDLEVFCDLNRLLHHAYVRDKHMIPQGNLYELRYEDLLLSPLDTIRSIYSRLNLGAFEPVEELLLQELTRITDHKLTTHQLSLAQQELIMRQCFDYFRDNNYKSCYC